jgi:hypothetical protein
LLVVEVLVDLFVQINSHLLRLVVLVEQEEVELVEHHHFHLVLLLLLLELLILVEVEVEQEVLGEMEDRESLLFNIQNKEIIYGTLCTDWY